MVVALVNRHGSLFKAHELSPAGTVTAAVLADVLDRLLLMDGSSAQLRAAS